MSLALSVNAARLWSLYCILISASFNFRARSWVNLTATSCSLVIILYYSSKWEVCWLNYSFNWRMLLFCSLHFELNSSKLFYLSSNASCWRMTSYVLIFKHPLIWLILLRSSSFCFLWLSAAAFWSAMTFWSSSFLLWWYFMESPNDPFSPLFSPSNL